MSQSANLIVTVEDSNGKQWDETWKDYYPTVTQEDAEEIGRHIINEFNGEEGFRYGKKANLRKFISVKIELVDED